MLILKGSINQHLIYQSKVLLYKVMYNYSYVELEAEKRYKRLLAFAKCIKASQDGDSCAKYELAEFYEKGDVCKNDINKAFLLLQEAAMDGFISANFRLGVSYIDGRLGYQDYSKAVKHLMLYVDTIKYNDGRLSCKDENQFREALILLAEMYKEGCGVEPSNEVFEEFLSRLQVGCGTIGDWYYYGDRFYAITINRTKARKWYEW